MLCSITSTLTCRANFPRQYVAELGAPRRQKETKSIIHLKELVFTNGYVGHTLSCITHRQTLLAKKVLCYLITQTLRHNYSIY